MTDKAEKPRISGKEATHAAMEAEKYGPIRIRAADDSPPNSNESPRVRKPSPQHDQLLAPTPDLEGYRTRLREAFGNTMSDEFVDVMLGKVVGFSHFVTSIAAPVASGWSGCRVGFAPTGKRRLFTAHARSGHLPIQS